MMNPSRYAKALAAAIVTFAMFIGRGVASGDWTDTESVSAALGVILLPLVVYLVPNDPPGTTLNKD